MPLLEIQNLRKAFTIPGGLPHEVIAIQRFALADNETVALGDLGRNGRIPMRGEQRLTPGRRGYLGTDLSGSHPISIVMPSTDQGSDDAADMGLRPVDIVGVEPFVETHAFAEFLHPAVGVFVEYASPGFLGHRYIGSATIRRPMRTPRRRQTGRPGAGLATLREDDYV